MRGFKTTAAAPSSRGQEAYVTTTIPHVSSRSGIALTGIPVEEENLASIGVLFSLKCGALDNSAAFFDGVKVPRSKRPLA
jgi:hypothetical protein